MSSRRVEVAMMQRMPRPVRFFDIPRRCPRRAGPPRQALRRADIALFAYTQSAGDIGYEIDAVLADWLAGVTAQAGYVPIRQ